MASWGRPPAQADYDLRSVNDKPKLKRKSKPSLLMVRRPAWDRLPIAMRGRPGQSTRPVPTRLACLVFQSFNPLFECCDPALNQIHPPRTHETALLVLQILLPAFEPPHAAFECCKIHCGLLEEEFCPPAKELPSKIPCPSESRPKGTRKLEWASRQYHQVTVLQIRNPKSEARNKSEYQMTQGSKHRSRERVLFI